MCVELSVVQSVVVTWQVGCLVVSFVVVTRQVGCNQTGGVFGSIILHNGVIVEQRDMETFVDTA